MKTKDMLKKALPVPIKSVYKNIKTIRDIYYRKIHGIQIYTTNRCNSKCKHCNIWQLNPKVDLPVEIVAKILNSKLVLEHTYICLEGGEFVLHPNIREILDLFSGRQVSLITNGILTDRICSLIEEYKISTLQISLDGTPETYKKMRGVDAYDNVIHTIECLKDKLEIIIAYTFSPWNNTEDYQHVKNIIQKYNLKLGFANVYTDEPYFKTDDPINSIRERIDLSEVEDPVDKRFLELHDLWLDGKLWLPCFSIFRSAIVYPEGDVFFCHHRKALLGNLHEQSLDEIWESKRTIALQKKHIDCNNCWCSYHRRFDVAMEKVENMMLKSKLFGSHRKPFHV